MYYLVLKNTVAGRKKAKAGDVIELHIDEAQVLVNMKRVEPTEAPQPKPTEAPQPKKAVKSKKTNRAVFSLDTPEDDD